MSGDSSTRTEAIESLSLLGTGPTLGAELGAPFASSHEPNDKKPAITNAHALYIHAPFLQSRRLLLRRSNRWRSKVWAIDRGHSATFQSISITHRQTEFSSPDEESSARILRATTSRFVHVSFYPSPFTQFVNFQSSFLIANLIGRSMTISWTLKIFHFVKINTKLSAKKNDNNFLFGHFMILIF